VALLAPQVFEGASPAADRAGIERAAGVEGEVPLSDRLHGPGSRGHSRSMKLVGSGRHCWCLAPNATSTAVLEVRKGVIGEGGTGDKSLTKGRKAQDVFH